MLSVFGWKMGAAIENCDGCSVAGFFINVIFLSFKYVSSAALFLFFEALLRVSRLVIMIQPWGEIPCPPRLRVSTMTIMISLLPFRGLTMHDSLYTFRRTLGAFWVMGDCDRLMLEQASFLVLE